MSPIGRTPATATGGPSRLPQQTSQALELEPEASPGSMISRPSCLRMFTAHPDCPTVRPIIGRLEAGWRDLGAVTRLYYSATEPSGGNR